MFIHKGYGLSNVNCALLWIHDDVNEYEYAIMLCYLTKFYYVLKIKVSKQNIFIYFQLLSQEMFSFISRNISM